MIETHPLLFPGDFLNAKESSDNEEEKNTDTKSLCHSTINAFWTLNIDIHQCKIIHTTFNNKFFKQTWASENKSRLLTWNNHSSAKCTSGRIWNRGSQQKENAF